MTFSILLGDIGGTKTTLSLYDETQDFHHPIVEKSFPSNEFSSLEDIISIFIQEEKPENLFYASFGVAGPVVKQVAQITNLPWKIDAAAIKETFSLKNVWLLNDLESIAYGTFMLRDEDVFVLSDKEENPAGSMAVIAPGTGLGEAFIARNADGFIVNPSEGGHSDFAPLHQLQADLLDYMLKIFDHVSFEKVCSGMAFKYLYGFLKDTGKAVEPEWLAKEIKEIGDVGPVVSKYALAPVDGSEICEMTLQLFVEILAAECSNMALKMLTSGGVYIGGGIPPKILPLFEKFNFMDVYAQKGRFADLVLSFPIKIILNPRTPLLGAGYYVSLHL